MSQTFLHVMVVTTHGHVWVSVWVTTTINNICGDSKSLNTCFNLKDIKNTYMVNTQTRCKVFEFHISKYQQSQFVIGERNKASLAKTLSHFFLESHCSLRANQGRCIIVFHYYLCDSTYPNPISSFFIRCTQERYIHTYIWTIH